MASDKLYFLADLHAISMPHVPAELTANTRAMTAALVACGIDTDRSILFNQARVPAHAELQWLLNGTARLGWLNRMTQFKDKSGKNRESASAALYTYPDRKSVVSGKSVSVRVDLGGRRIIKKKTTQPTLQRRTHTNT